MPCELFVVFQVEGGKELAFWLAYSEDTQEKIVRINFSAIEVTHQFQAVLLIFLTYPN